MIINIIKKIVIFICFFSQILTSIFFDEFAYSAINFLHNLKCNFFKLNFNKNFIKY